MVENSFCSAFADSLSQQQTHFHMTSPSLTHASLRIQDSPVHRFVTRQATKGDISILLK